MRPLLFVLLCLLPLPAAALCRGDDIRDRLSAADLAAVDAAVAATPFATGYLHRATKDDRQITVIGTMHLHDPRLAPIAARVAPDVAAAGLLLVEAGPEEEAAMTAAMTADPTIMFMPDGPTLPEQLDEDVWQALVLAVSDRGIPAVLASRMQPWYLGLVLAIPPCAMDDLTAGRAGLDAALIAQAQDAGVPVQALEPWDTLFDIMRADPIAVQLDQLRLALSPPALQQDMFATMLDHYFAGDIAALWEVSRAAVHLLPDTDPAQMDALFALSEQQLLHDRNHNWMPGILSAAQDHPRLVVAVGAAHLPGTTGVLNLLAQDGWTITTLD